MRPRPPRMLTFLLPVMRGEILCLCANHKPTVCLGVTSAVADTYGYDDGRNGPTRCALIGAVFGDRWSQCRACSMLPAGAGSARSAFVAGSRWGSPADPGGFHR